MCVIFVENTQKLAHVSEFPPNMFFYSWKRMLISIGFTVYEFVHSQGRRLPRNRRAMLTHLAFANEAQCTKAVVSKVPATQLHGDMQIINFKAVVFINQWDNPVRRPAIIQTNSSSTSEGASGCPVEQANGVDRKRRSVQDVDEDAEAVSHKQPRSSASGSVRQHHLSVSDAAKCSGCKVDNGLDQIQMLELSTWSEIVTAFNDSANASRASIEPAPNVSGLSLDERLGSIRSFLGL